MNSICVFRFVAITTCHYYQHLGVGRILEGVRQVLSMLIQIKWNMFKTNIGSLRHHTEMISFYYKQELAFPFHGSKMSVEYM